MSCCLNSSSNYIIFVNISIYLYFNQWPLFFIITLKASDLFYGVMLKYFSSDKSNFVNIEMPGDFSDLIQPSL